MIPSLSHAHLIQTNQNEYPLKFDTRNQNIPLQQIIQDNTFFPVDLTNANNNQQDSTNNQDNQSTDAKQFMQTFTGLNSSMIFCFSLINKVSLFNYLALTSQTPTQSYTVSHFLHRIFILSQRILFCFSKYNLLHLNNNKEGIIMIK